MIKKNQINLIHLPFSVNRIFTFIGLTISVIGSGSMRANLTALGGDQFNLPGEKEYLFVFFILQIFAIKLGVFVGRLTNKILIDNVSCYGMDHCYPLVFSIPAAAMVIGFSLLLCGKSSFLMKSPSGNTLFKIVKCIMVSHLVKILT